MNDRVFIIAEAGVNHNGSLEKALQLIDVARDAGADAVKFQTFRTRELVTTATPKAGYQIANTGDGSSQFAMLTKLELDAESHRVLQRRCAECGIIFLSTPFDLGSLQFLAGDLGVSMIKISSGDLTNAPLLLAAARCGRPLILSTGMATLAEVETALGVVAFGCAAPESAGPGVEAFANAYLSDAGQQALQSRATLLHCTTEYPAPFAEVNLRAIDTLRAAFGLRVGFSDHTLGVAAAVAAVARGASVIEKHFTLDRELPGPDHLASLDPAQLRLLVSSVREVEACLGNGVKRPAGSELANRQVARRGLVARADIRKGEPFTPENLAVKRVTGALDPIQYWHLLGRKASRDYVLDDRVEIDA